jgi:hypothetical protein
MAGPLSYEQLCRAGGAKPPIRRCRQMSQHIDPARAEELYQLYAELHLACGRAAAALRLSGNWDAPVDEMLERFRSEEATAVRIWQDIQRLKTRP